jgi:hypothetical protein
LQENPFVLVTSFLFKECSLFFSSPKFQLVILRRSQNVAAQTPHHLIIFFVASIFMSNYACSAINQSKD